MRAMTYALATILTMVWPSAAAVAVDITFDDVSSVGNPLVAGLDTHGYRFTGPFRTIDTPGAAMVSNGSPVYLGQEASGSGITATRPDGGPFILYGFDATGLYLPSSRASANAGQVHLVGLKIGGSLLSATYELSGLPSFAHFSVPTTWSDLQAVTFTGLLSAGPPGAFALDDVGVGQGPANVAEPGTLALALLTALGVCGMVLLRHRSQPFRTR